MGMKKKTKEIKPPMKFNVALQKYEPVLPSSRRKGKEIKFKDSWQWLIVVIICIALLGGVLFLVKRGLV